MKIKKIFYKTLKFTNRNLPNILTGLSVLGVFSTSLLTAKATPIILDKKNKIKFEDDSKSEDRELMIDILNLATPAISSGLFTSATIITSNAISQKRIKGLSQAYNNLYKNYKEYGIAAASALGIETNNKIKEYLNRKKIEDEKTTLLPQNTYHFVDEYTRQTFISTPEDVIAAQYILNRMFAMRGYATLNDYCDLLRIPKVDDGGLLGWDIAVGEEFCGYQWIDFINVKHEDDDGTVWYSIEMIFEPTIDGYFKFEASNEEIDIIKEDMATLLG